MQAIETIELTTSESSIIFDDIPATFTDLLVVTSLRSDRVAATENLVFRLNGDATNQNTRLLRGDGSSASSFTNTSPIIGILPTANSTSNTFDSSSIYVSNYASSSAKSFSAETVSENNATTAYQHIVAGLYDDTDAVTSITLTTSNGSNFVQYSSATLYGITSGSDGTTTVS